jgi:hypothetical protein
MREGGQLSGERTQQLIIQTLQDAARLEFKVCDLLRPTLLGHSRRGYCAHVQAQEAQRMLKPPLVYRQLPALHSFAGD